MQILGTKIILVKLGIAQVSDISYFYEERTLNFCIRGLSSYAHLDNNFCEIFIVLLNYTCIFTPLSSSPLPFYLLP